MARHLRASSGHSVGRNIWMTRIWMVNTYIEIANFTLIKWFYVNIFIPPPTKLEGDILDSPCPSTYNYKTLQEESAKKSNIPWMWRIIYGHKLPYMKKTRKKKQVCGAAYCMAAEIKFSKDVRLSARRRHGFRSINQVCFRISIWNFIFMFMVVIGRSL